MSKKNKIVLIVLSILSMIFVFPCAFTACDANETPSERMQKLSSEMEALNCERYEYEIDEYTLDSQPYKIGVTIYYNNAYKKDKINDLYTIKEQIENCVNDNIKLFKGYYCYVMVYDLIDKDLNIPRAYIEFVNDSVFTANTTTNVLDYMKINMECSAEQFEDIEISVDTLEIMYGEIYQFDKSILLYFTDLKHLILPEEFSLDSEEAEIYLPVGCEIEYN